MVRLSALKINYSGKCLILIFSVEKNIHRFIEIIGESTPLLAMSFWIFIGIRMLNKPIFGIANSFSGLGGEEACLCICQESKVPKQ